MELDDSVSKLKGIGPGIVEKLAPAHITTVGDLMNFWPRAYKDYSVVSLIKDIRPGAVTIRAIIKQVKGRYVRRGMHLTEAVASDPSGSIRIIWFNQPYRPANLKPNMEYFLSGQYNLSHGRFSITNPSAEIVSEVPTSTARIVPEYRQIKGVKSPMLRRIIKTALPLTNRIPEMLPESIRYDGGLLPRGQAIAELHFPSSAQRFELARRTLAFEEIFILSLAALMTKRQITKISGLTLEFDLELAKQFVNSLPFKLTADQRRAVWQIYQDMAKKWPMNRLIEGDVGAGKTVVAVMSALMVIKHNWQVALMAPTELLARQHAATVTQLLEPLGLADKIGLLVGSLPLKSKQLVRSAIKSKQLHFIIGTQALLQDSVRMNKLGLVIIDEQHRFGVEQRNVLQQKAGHMPHVLSLTATPIPRSLALTLYGDLDVSRLLSRPSGRLPITTKLIHPTSVAKVYEEVENEIKKGRQTYWVCPLISDSAVTSYNKPASASAEITFEHLTKIFKKRRVGLLHGKMPAKNKDNVMKLFADKELDILVSTTVIEVGVDIPNATIMVIQNADQFGLAQLHQLRGRVGRNSMPAQCFLILSDSKRPSARLKAVTQSQNGFDLAELDLKLRGPGSIYGLAQHGVLDLRLARFSDTRLLNNARRAANNFLDKNLDIEEFPLLNQAVQKAQSITRLD